LEDWLSRASGSAKFQQGTLFYTDSAPFQALLPATQGRVKVASGSALDQIGIEVAVISLRSDTYGIIGEWQAADKS